MSERIIIAVKEGKVRGVKRRSEYSGAEFYSFFGVPYGQPPINALRFKDPVKVKPWKDVYDATIEKEGCIQFSLVNVRFMGTENCLYNNIHTPELPTKSSPLKPVIAVLHPGGYLYGSPNENEYGSTNFIIHNDFVYVGIAHRLHILGFLNLGLKECSGNQGIKDIILSLRWIKDNISSFGGDPENVTLLGSSSGATSVHILMLSPAAKGLFHKAVILGDGLFDPTSIFQETNEKIAFDMAKFLGYEDDTHDKKKLLSFLKKVNAAQFVDGLRKHIVEIRRNFAPILPYGIFSPTIDHGENAVLPKHPRQLIPSTMNIPLIVGCGDKESALGFARGLIREGTEKNFKTSIRQNQWGWGSNLNEDEIELIYKQVEDFYLQGKSLKNATLSTKIDIQTGLVLSDIYDTLINVVASDTESPVYVYRFQFEGELRTVKQVSINLYDERIEGTFHGDDFFHWNRVNDPENDKTKQMIADFTKLIITFARTGNPNFQGLKVRWEPTRPESPCYLSINNNLEMVDGRVHEEKLAFWDSIKKGFKKED